MEWVVKKSWLLGNGMHHNGIKGIGDSKFLPCAIKSKILLGVEHRLFSPLASFPCLLHVKRVVQHCTHDLFLFSPMRMLLECNKSTTKPIIPEINFTCTCHLLFQMPSLLKPSSIFCM